MIHITPQAARQVRDLVAEKNSSEEMGLRLAIERGGCAGLQYAMTLGPKKSEDILLEHAGAKIFIDAPSSEQLADCTLDYEEELAGSGFRIINPKAVRSCGCGTSFEPKEKANPVKGKE